MPRPREEGKGEKKEKGGGSRTSPPPVRKVLGGGERGRARRGWGEPWRCRPGCGSRWARSRVWDPLGGLGTGRVLARLAVRFGTSVPLCCGSLAPPEAQPSSQANSGVEGKCSRSVLIFLTRNASRAAGLCSGVSCTNKPCGANNRYRRCILVSS